MKVMTIEILENSPKCFLAIAKTYVIFYTKLYVFQAKICNGLVHAMEVENHTSKGKYLLEIILINFHKSKTLKPLCPK